MFNLIDKYINLGLLSKISFVFNIFYYKIYKVFNKFFILGTKYIIFSGIKKKLKKIKLKKNKLIIKLVKLQLEKMLFKIIEIPLKISLKNIFMLFEIKKVLKIPKKGILWKNWRYIYFKDFINIIFFSIFLRKSYILARFLSENITNKKIHFSFLKKIKRLLNNFLYYGTYYNLIGIIIKVHGKFQGKLRKRKFKYIFGKTSSSTLTTHVDFSLQKSYTKYGVFSIKVFFFYSKNDKQKTSKI